MPLVYRLTIASIVLAPLTIHADEGPGPDELRQMFRPLPSEFTSTANPATQAKVELGRMLYFDKRLSKNQDVSCNSCHVLDKYGVDHQSTSLGHKKQKGVRNSLTVYNVGAQFAQFWDGRARTLEDQAKMPIMNPIEMGMADGASAVKVIKSIPGYPPLFQAAFPNDTYPITIGNIARAIAAFERKLVTPGRFDKWLSGDAKALSPTEVAGLSAFVEIGCSECHVGTALGGTMFQKLGKEVPVPNLIDKGRFEATKNVADTYFFKVPSLRNVEHTHPYLHDGSIKSLPEMVTFMAKYQHGKTLEKKQVDSIVAFLKSLTGELPKKLIAAPKLPPSGDDTPKPDPN